MRYKEQPTKKSSPPTFFEKTDRRLSFLGGVALLALVLLAGGCAAPRSTGYKTERYANDSAASPRESSPSPLARSKAQSKAPRAAGAPIRRRLAYRRFRRRRSYRRHKSRQEKAYGRRSRPGLGTRQGENRYAPVRYTRFVRSSTRPLATARLHYNDPSGVRAMARHLRVIPALPRLRVGSLSLQLTNARGRPLHGIRRGGYTLVMGRHNQRYIIVVRNNTGRRFEVVLSVDGMDVIDSGRASVSKRGYIIRPHSLLRVEGFRRNHRYVSAFRFSSVRNSHANRAGQGHNVGVIGIAVFGERSPRWSPGEIERRLGAQPFAEPT